MNWCNRNCSVHKGKGALGLLEGRGSKISKNRPVATLAATAGGIVRANGLTMAVPVEVLKWSGGLLKTCSLS